MSAEFGQTERRVSSIIKLLFGPKAHAKQLFVPTAGHCLAVEVYSQSSLKPARIEVSLRSHAFTILP
jgi:hypothetical protein